MYNNLYASLGNDSTNIYEVDSHCFPRYIEPWEIQQVVDDHIENRCYYFPDLLSFGEHDDSDDVHRSNVRVFWEEFRDSEFVTLVCYPGGGKSIGIDLLCTDQSILDSLAALATDPVMNMTDLSNLQEEIKTKAWENWIKKDFTNALEKKFKADWINPDDKQLYQLYLELQKKSNHYPEIAKGNVYIKIDLLLQHLQEAPAFLNLEYFKTA